MTLGPFVGHDKGVSTVSEMKVEFSCGRYYVDMRFGDRFAGLGRSMRDDVEVRW